MMRFLAACMAVAAAMPAAAQTIYRCGSEYSQSPCPGARQIEPEPSPRAEEAKSARDQARRNAHLAETLRRERTAAEEKVAGPAVVVTGQKAATPETTKEKRKPAPFRASTARKPKTSAA